MQIINYLSSKSLSQLKEELGIEYVLSDCGKLVILNYSQINSPKSHPIVQECRGLCLELPSFKVVAKSFNRFYNYGELESQNNFNWDNFVTQEKLDGSLLKIYNYNGRWSIQTRASFAGGLINGSNYTWESLFFPLVKNLHNVPENITLVCEGTSVYNKVVRHYSEPSVWLLTAFNNDTLEEFSIEATDELASVTELKRPPIHQFSSAKECLDYLNAITDLTFEGFVLKDNNNNRIKIKNSTYVNLHHLRNNKNLFLLKNILPIVLRGEQDEVLLFWPEFREKFEKVEAVVDELKRRLSLTWSETKAIVNQKQFALAIATEPAKAVLFNARKLNDFDAAWCNSENVILKEVEKML